MSRFLPVIAVALLMGSPLASAQAPSAPAARPAVRPAAPRILTGEQLKASMDARQKMVVVDTRTPDEIAQARIAGSVNIPAGFVRALS